MHRLLVPIFAVFVLVLGLGTFASAQDATPPADTEEENFCPEAADMTGASPQATEAGSGMATPPAMDEASPEASPEGEECHVDIVDFAFSPQAIEIEVGTTVTWENYDSTAHTVTADDGSFDSGNLEPDADFSHTFDQAGEFTYHCMLHP